MIETFQSGDAAWFTADQSTTNLGRVISNEPNQSIRVRPLNGNQDGTDDVFLFPPNIAQARTLKSLIEPQ